MQGLVARVQTPKGEVIINALVDLGAEANCIRQFWATDNGLSLEHSAVKTVKSIEGRYLRCFGKYNLSIGAIDNKGDSYFSTHEFQALLSLEGYDIILGFLWLRSINPDINWRNNTFTYRKTDPVEEEEPHLEAFDAVTEVLAGAKAYLGALREYLEKVISKGWIRPSKSLAGAPILFVPKKDGGLRMCVDYRGLNQITIKNRYPLPLISELLDRLLKAKFLGKINIRDAYTRIPIREKDRWMTAFRTRYGYFEYCIMPFGLANAPTTFQAYINEIFADLLDQFCVVYLDDILIFSDTLEDHKAYLITVFERLASMHLYIKASKCEFEKTKISFLGYIISLLGIKIEEDRISIIKEWPTPKSVKEV
ncbi:hypothetical protein TEQG_08797 [Trichophyton equinum CBS 127.97]|uniref:Reverse transcriptase domain-containing protein n=1 Tax=Trichophyton equinum (strain ATCC MYA-4606 / CBS 127.97) TaxID=559882 RepID=F2Q2K9_TRIEC|nr:hypothetical protein TEQG_08797 [Trichophyton equinum CBS 127.97]